MILLIIISAAIILLILYRLILSARQNGTVKKFITQILILTSIVLLLILTITGKISWLITAVSFLLIALKSIMLWMVRALPVLIRFFPFINRFTHQQKQRSNNPTTNQLSKKEALDILGLQEGASKKKIIQTHKIMIQKLHPDRGGSPHLAAKLNSARDTLLNE